MKNILIVLSAFCLFILGGCGSNNRYFHGDFLKTRGAKIVDRKGQEVYLYGVNIGGWMLVEPSLLKLDKPGIRSGKDLFEKLESRFGRNQAADLYRIYMDKFITAQDIKAVADTGANCIRVPFWYASLLDPKYAKREFYYLDRIIGWAKSSRLYVIIDMHGAPGGQSADAESTCGDGSNRLWTDPANLNETISIWKRIAQRYRNETAVAGYDLLNEPSGAPSLPGSVKDLVHFYNILYRTIRGTDTNHLIFMQDAGAGIHRMPQPLTMGWENVVYSFHFYPSTNDMRGYASAVTGMLPFLKRAQLYLDVPFHVGEFNSIQEQAGGVRAMRSLFDAFRAFGWSWNLWTYKKIEDRPEYNWGMTGYVDTQTDIDLNSATIEIFRDLFTQYDTAYLKNNSALETAVGEFSASVNAPGPLNRLRNDLVFHPEEGAMVRATNGSIRMDWTVEGPLFKDWGEGDSAGWLVTVTNPGVYGMTLESPGMSVSNTAFPMDVWIDGHFYTNIAVLQVSSGISGGKAPSCFLMLSNGIHVLELKALKNNGLTMDLVSMELFPTNMTNGYAVPDFRTVRLSPLYFYAFNQTNGDACIEWQNPQGNTGHWMNGEGLSWAFESDADATYRVTLEVSSTNGGSRFQVSANADARTNEVAVPDTRDPGKFRSLEAGRLKFRKGVNLLFIRAVTRNTAPAGNLGGIRLQRSGE